MATKRPAKIASQKKGRLAGRMCPACDTEMSMAKVMREQGASGMYWLCGNGSCNTLMTTAGAVAGKLEI